MALNDIKLGESGSEYLLSAYAREFTEGMVAVTREGRTASGRLVRDVTATKRKFTLAYELISQDDLDTFGTLYALDDELSLLVTRPDSSIDSYTVLLQPFDKTRAKSVGMDYWTGVTIEMEEV